jgi:hypothetical protein
MRFFEKRPPSFSPNLPEQNAICKTLPASEFQQKAHVAGLRAAHVDAAAHGALSVAQF